MPINRAKSCCLAQLSFDAVPAVDVPDVRYHAAIRIAGQKAYLLAILTASLTTTSPLLPSTPPPSTSTPSPPIPSPSTSSSRDPPSSTPSSPTQATPTPSPPTLSTTTSSAPTAYPPTPLLLTPSMPTASTPTALFSNSRSHGHQPQCPIRVNVDRIRGRSGDGGAASR